MPVSGSKGFRIFAVLVLVFSGWFTAQYLFHPDQNYDSAHRNAPDQLTVKSGCDASRTQCLAENKSIQLYLRLGPPVDVLEPFPVEVSALQVEGNYPDSVEVEFLMTGMDMGTNRYRLESVENGQWRGSAVLPVCTTGRRDWRAVVNVNAGENRLQASFSFTVER